MFLLLPTPSLPFPQRPWFQVTLATGMLFLSPGCPPHASSLGLPQETQTHRGAEINTIVKMTQRTQKLPRIVCLELYLFLVLLDYKYFKVASGSLSDTRLLSSLVHSGSGTHVTRVLACVGITNPCVHYKAGALVGCRRPRKLCGKQARGSDFRMQRE